MSKKISTEAVRSEWSYSRDPGPEHRTTEEWWQIRDDALAEFDSWLDQVKADAWDEGADTAWKATGEGHNGEYAGPFGTHDGTVPFLRANEDITNPYREQEEA